MRAAALSAVRDVELWVSATHVAAFLAVVAAGGWTPMSLLAVFGAGFALGWRRRAAEMPVGGHSQTLGVLRSDDSIVVKLRDEEGGVVTTLTLNSERSRAIARAVLGTEEVE